MLLTQLIFLEFDYEKNTLWDAILVFYCWAITTALQLNGLKQQWFAISQDSVIDWWSICSSSWSVAFSWQEGWTGGPRKLISCVLSPRVACYLGHLCSTVFLSLLLRLHLHWHLFLQSLSICSRSTFITLQHGSWAPKQQERKLLGFSHSSTSALTFWPKQVTANAESRGEETESTSCWKELLDVIFAL